MAYGIKIACWGMTSCTNASTANLGVDLSILSKARSGTHPFIWKQIYFCMWFEWQLIFVRKNKHQDSFWKKKGGLHVVWKLLNTANFVRFVYFLLETSSRQSRNLQLTRPSQQEEKHFWVSDLKSAMGGHPRNITQQKQLQQQSSRFL